MPREKTSLTRAETKVHARGETSREEIEEGMRSSPDVPGRCRKRLCAAGAVRGTVSREEVRLRRWTWSGSQWYHD